MQPDQTLSDSSRIVGRTYRSALFFVTINELLFLGIVIALSWLIVGQVVSGFLGALIALPVIGMFGLFLWWMTRLPIRTTLQGDELTVHNLRGTHTIKLSDLAAVSMAFILGRNVSAFYALRLTTHSGSQVFILLGWIPRKDRIKFYQPVTSFLTLPGVTFKDSSDLDKCFQSWYPPKLLQQYGLSDQFPQHTPSQLTRSGANVADDDYTVTPVSGKRILKLLLIIVISFIVIILLVGGALYIGTGGHVFTNQPPIR